MKDKVNMYIKYAEKYEVFDKIKKWVGSLSERTLQMSAVVILHLSFMPLLLAHINGITDELPNLDSYMLVGLALVVLNVRAIIKKDSLAIFVHMVGFVSQLIVISTILLK